jgi:nucleotide-binding universal stress UspA family protein
MRPSLPRYRIVVALDASEYSEIVLEHAIDQAARHESAELHVIRVIPPGADLDASHRRLAAEMAQGLELLGGHGPDGRSRLHVIEGKPEEEIVALAADVRADLIVIGRFEVSAKRGSVADRVIAHAPCPTLVVGLTEHEIESQPQCPACVEVRAESDGERWFCDEHLDGRRRLTLPLPSSTTSIGGGPLL